MAKLKINEAELEIPLEQQVPSKNALQKLKNELELDKLNQSVSSLSKQVTALNQLILTKEKQLNVKIEQNKKLIDVDKKVFNFDNNILDNQIQNIEKKLKDEMNKLTVEVHQLKSQVAEKASNTEVVVKEKVTYKTYDKEIRELKEEFAFLKLNLAQLEKIKSSKVVRIERSNAGLQKKINVVLTVGLIASLLLHIL